MDQLLSKHPVALACIAVLCAVVTGWLIMHDLGLGSLLGLTALLLAAWKLEFPRREWLCCDQMKGEKERLGEIEVISPRLKQPAARVADSLVEVRKYVFADVRCQDTAQLIDDMREAIVKALFIYLFVSMGSVVYHFQLNDPGLAEPAKSFEVYKLHGFCVYCGITLAYACWHISPVLIQRKRNHAVVV